MEILIWMCGEGIQIEMSRKLLNSENVAQREVRGIFTDEN